jgi:hypothetical protein
MSMPTKEKPARATSRKPPAPEPVPHRMTAAAREHVRQMVESPGFNNPTLRAVWQELELVTAERDAALARLGEA